MDEIDFEEPEMSICDCCGTESVRLTRFVTRDGDAFAVYFAAFTAGHPEAGVNLIVGFGDWSEGAPETGREAFSFRLWTDETRFITSIEDPNDEIFPATVLGRKLDRAQGLAHPLCREVFDLSDHIVRCDEPIKKFLDP
jgi:hypothetical protein